MEKCRAVEIGTNVDWSVAFWASLAYDKFSEKYQIGSLPYGIM